MNDRINELFWRAFFVSTCIMSGFYLAAIAYQYGVIDGAHQPRYLSAYLRNRITRTGNVLTVPFRKTADIKEQENEPSK